MTSVVFLSLALAFNATPQTASGSRPAPQTTATAKPGNLILTVTSGTGALLAGALVAVHGPVDRGGTTGADGVVTLQNMPAGTYRCRIARDGFITLEKELTIRAGVRLTAEGVLSPAPAPPQAPSLVPPPPSSPSPSPAPRPAMPAGIPGSPRVLSIPDLAEQLLREAQPVVEREIGCSVATSSRLIVARQIIALHNHADADEMLYLVAGEAALKLGERDQNVGPGWFGLVPRGLSHALTPRGRGPIVLLSIRSGPPCAQS